MLEDQFRRFGPITVGPPRFFCNPCVKIADREYPIVDPEVHLAVYEILPPTFTGSVQLIDQFVTRQVQVVSVPPEYLFVPSSKRFATPVEPSTWGSIKSIYHR
jgi:hypothetical protein